VKKALIIDSSPFAMGALKSISRFAKCMNGDLEFFWAVSQSLPDTDIDRLAGHFRRFHLQELKRRPLDNFLYLPRLILDARRLVRWIRDENIDIVHVNECISMTGIVIKMMHPSIALVYHVRLLRDSFIKPLYRVFLTLIDRWANAIICCSEHVARDVGETTAMKTVIHDGEFFDGPPPLARGSHSPLRILYVGNIVPGKGQDLGLRAFSTALSQYPDLELRFVGKFGHTRASAEFKNVLDTAVRDLRLDDAVTFVGYRSDVTSELLDADILLNLSESESFSLVCLEGLKAGVPLIAADSGGPAELFEHMRSGFLVPNGGVTEAANAIKMLAGDPEKRRSFAAEGFLFVKKKFNIAELSEKLSKVYDQALNATAGRAG
jgi:L-malate glycosyltransferase